jgi:hypothetical protein
MKKGFIPRRIADLLVWLQNYGINIPVIGKAMSIPATDITQQQSGIQDFTTQAAKVASLQAELDANKSTLADMKAKLLGQIKPTVAHMKNNPLWTKANSQTLRTESVKAPPFDADNYKANLKWIKIVAGKVQVGFNKNGADGVNVYRRIKGQAPWTMLGRANKSPWTDIAEAAAPGTAISYE